MNKHRRIHTKTEKTGDHEFSAVADGVDRAVLDDYPLVAGQESLQWGNDVAEVLLVAVVIVHPLGVENIVQSDHILCLVHGSTPHTAELLHMGTHTEQETQVHAKSTDIGSCLAADPEHTKLPLIVELVELALVDGTDTELTLDSRNKRGALEERASQGLKSASELSFTTWQLVVHTDDANVFLSGTLLGLDETSGAIDADNETSSDLGIESTTVTGLLDSIQRLEKFG